MPPACYNKLSKIHQQASRLCRGASICGVIYPSAQVSDINRNGLPVQFEYYQMALPVVSDYEPRIVFRTLITIPSPNPDASLNI